MNWLEVTGWGPVRELLSGGGYYFPYLVRGSQVGGVQWERFPLADNQLLPFVAFFDEGQVERFAVVEAAREWVEAKAIEALLLRGAP